MKAVEELKQSLVNAARRFARDKRQGYGKEIHDVLQQVERLTLLHRLSERCSTEHYDVESPIVDELADIIARLRRLEGLFEAVGDEALGRSFSSAPVRPVPIARGEALAADCYFSPFNGFYPLEVEPSGSAFRWTGPTHEFQFDLAFDRTQAACFQLGLRGGVQPSQCEGIFLIADGVHIPVEVSLDNAGYTISFELPPAPFSEITRLVFVVPRVFRPADSDGGTDLRMLGVCFVHLKLLT